MSPWAETMNNILIPSVTTASLEDCKGLAEQIQAKRLMKLESKIKPYPRKNVIASDIPHCARAGVYGILHWDQNKLHDADLQARFDAGNYEERDVLSELDGL